MKKEVKRTEKNGEEIGKTTSYRLQFMDSTNLMASSLSNLVNNLSEGIHKIKCKDEHDEFDMKLVQLNIKIASTFLNTQALKMI